RRACQGRDVSDDSLKRLAQEVEERVRSHGSSQVNANEIGLAILDPLRDLDEVAYLRFASVYKSFDSADDFESEILLMRSRECDVLVSCQGSGLVKACPPPFVCVAERQHERFQDAGQTGKREALESSTGYLSPRVISRAPPEGCATCCRGRPWHFPPQLGGLHPYQDQR